MLDAKNVKNMYVIQIIPVCIRPNTDVVTISYVKRICKELAVRRTEANACINQRNNMICGTKERDLVHQLCEQLMNKAADV